MKKLFNSMARRLFVLFLAFALLIPIMSTASAANAKGPFNYVYAASHSESGDRYRTNQNAVAALKLAWQTGHLYTDAVYEEAKYLFNVGNEWLNWSDDEFYAALDSLTQYNNALNDVDAELFIPVAIEKGILYKNSTGKISIKNDKKLDDLRQELFFGLGSDQFLQDFLDNVAEICGMDFIVDNAGYIKPSKRKLGIFFPAKNKQ